MKITTKTGDKGFSGLYNGKRLKKSDKLFSLLGDIDELSSFLGWTKSEIVFLKKGDFEFFEGLLLKIQDDLYKIMSFVGFEFKYPKTISSLNEDDTKFLENTLSDFMDKIREIKEFVRPGKGKISSMFHFARAICRRAERSFVSICKKDKGLIELIYLNRLSDLLFVFAIFFEEKQSI